MSEQPDVSTDPTTTDSEMSTPVTETPESTVDETAPSAEDVAAEEAAATADGGVEVEVVVEDVEGAPAVVPARRTPGERPVLTVGRRKEAIVRVRLVPGTGEFTLSLCSCSWANLCRVHNS